MIKRILVGTDGSDHAQRAVAFAAELALQLRAEVILVHVAGSFPPAVAAGGYMTYIPQDIIDETREELERRVQRDFVTPLKRLGVRYRAVVRDGWAPTVLGDVALEESADLVVVGNRGLHALGEFFLGSTSHALTHHAPVPLVVVPNPVAHAHKHESKGVPAAMPS